MDWLHSLTLNISVLYSLYWIYHILWWLTVLITTMKHFMSICLTKYFFSEVSYVLSIVNHSGNGLLPVWHHTIIRTSTDFFSKLAITEYTSGKFDLKYRIFVQSNAFANILCKISATLPIPQYLKYTSSQVVPWDQFWQFHSAMQFGGPSSCQWDLLTTNTILILSQ